MAEVGFVSKKLFPVRSVVIHRALRGWGAGWRREHVEVLQWPELTTVRGIKTINPASIVVDVHVYFDILLVSSRLQFRGSDCRTGSG